MRKLLVVLALAALPLAGCTVPAGSAPGDPLAAAAGHRPFLALRDCVEGGAHSIYNQNLLWYQLDILPEPFEFADVREDVGDQLLTTTSPPLMPTPPMGPLFGIYHATLRCDAWSWMGEVQRGPFDGGFVAIRVEPPPFDTGGAERHYLLDVFSVKDASLQEAMHARGFHATLGGGVFERDGLFLHTVLEDAEHGTYDSWFRTRDQGAMPQGTQRMWLLVPEGEQFRPLAIDFVTEGGSHLVSDGQAWFTHLQTDDHAPLPGFAGNTAGLAYEGFHRAVAWGPAPDLLLDEGWTH